MAATGPPLSAELQNASAIIFDETPPSVSPETLSANTFGLCWPSITSYTRSPESEFLR
ncbi:hypothetical protein TorRG33x02_257010 [Trema orientale]|uniref:Uncharacterized protein n=1 Tax=Trema orientale TaxID=63057 RepID=A0A2P5DAL5_TREOI|nr:hypothetical protein TorRG33x02_257010 [Trema orientale]